MRSRQQHPIYKPAIICYLETFAPLPPFSLVTSVAKVAIFECLNAKNVQLYCASPAVQSTPSCAYTEMTLRNRRGERNEKCLAFILPSELCQTFTLEPPVEPSTYTAQYTLSTHVYMSTNSSIALWRKVDC